MNYYTPPERFGTVEKGVYRSDMLHHSHFSYIKTLQLKTVLVLSAEVPMRAVTNFLEENNIKLGLQIHLGFEVWKPYIGWRPVSEELIKDGLELLLDVTNHPILIMCTSGIHETGTFVGCLRKLQNWNFSSIVIEVALGSNTCLCEHADLTAFFANKYRSYAGNKARYVNEQFIELFDMDLITLPWKNLPPWFVEQRRLLQEEEEEYKQQQNLNMEL